VFHAFTNSTALREWLCDAAMVSPARTGASTSGGPPATTPPGLHQVVPSERISFTWQGKGEPARLGAGGSPPDGDGTVVELVHKGLGSGKKWAGAAAAMQQGWETGLDNLRSVLETGHDLRFTRRPMLGILPDALDPRGCRPPGSPTDKGILLGGVVEGMGAAAAGLRQGDVIVRIGKGKTRDGAGLQTPPWPPRRRRSRGRLLPGAEKAKAMMTLSAGRSTSRRPPPPAWPPRCRPPARSSWAAWPSPSKASTTSGRPAAPVRDSGAPARCSCHLISAERATHDYITQLVGGAEHWIDEWPGKPGPRPRRPACRLPTAGGLLKELRRNRAETWAMLAALPDEFVPARAPTGAWRTASSKAASTTTGTWPRSRQRWRRSSPARNAPVGAGTPAPTGL